MEDELSRTTGFYLVTDLHQSARRFECGSDGAESRIFPMRNYALRALPRSEGLTPLPGTSTAFRPMDYPVRDACRRFGGTS